MPHHFIELNYAPETIVVGVDEVNFSPSLCGDCVVCALWLPLNNKIEGIDDSKKLTHRKRLEVFKEIQKEAVYIVVPGNVSIIINYGIFKARDMAMSWAINALDDLLNHKIDKILIDGPVNNRLKLMNHNVQFIVGGDSKSALIGAASIVAKVTVDALFEGYNVFWPGYGVNKNHGSPSKEHYKALKTLDPSPIHRYHPLLEKQKYGDKWWANILE